MKYPAAVVGAIAILCCVHLSPSLANESTLPAITATRAETPVRVDGKLDDATWQRTPAQGGFTVFRGTNTAVYATEFRTAFDDQWLYLAFVCHHPRPDIIPQNIFDHDGGVHKDDSVEVFLDPGTGGEMYFHYKVSHANVKAEKRVTRKGGPEIRWDTPWRATSARTETGWTAEVAIPLYLLASYGQTERARINIARNAVVPLFDDCAARIGDRREGSSWSRVGHSFHETERFGRLGGLGSIRAKVPFLVSFQEPRVGRYTREDGRYRYNVSLVLVGHTPAPGAVKIIVTDHPASGKGESVSRDVTFRGIQRTPMDIPVPVTTLVGRHATVVLEDLKTGEQLQAARVTDAAILNLMSAYLDRNYYTSEKTASTSCKVTMPADALRGAVLTVQDGKNQVLGRAENVALETTIPFAVHGLPVGTNTVTVNLRDGSGELMFSKALSLIKRPPKPGLEWKVDQVNKVLLRDGQPFFPHGPVMYALIQGRDNDYYRRVAEAGFNTYMQWGPCPPGKIDEYQQMVASNKMNVLSLYRAWANCPPELTGLEDFLTGDTLEYARTFLKHRSYVHAKGMLMFDPVLRKITPRQRGLIYRRVYEQNLPITTEAVNKLKNDPTVIGYNLFDEPPESHHFPMYLTGRALYRKLHELDGYHPTFLLYSSHIAEGDEYIDWTDAVGTDPYWQPEATGVRGTINFVSKITALTKRRADALQKITWIVPMAEYYSGTYKRGIEPREQVCQTYLALIHGAKALFYFRLPVVHQQSWEALCNVAKHLQTLGPIAVTPDIPQTVAYEPGEFDPDKDKYPDVQVSLRRKPDGGGLVLLAANTKHHYVDTTYRLSCLGQAGNVGRLFNKNRYPVKDGSFSDRLQAFETRAYDLYAAGDKLEAPVQITVSAMPAPKAGPRPLAFPNTGRPGKKNIAPNPSFEEASLPGWPDYYKFGYSEPMFGAEGAGCGQDTTNPVDGKFCLRISKNQLQYNTMSLSLAPQNAKPTRYVLSVYLRADRDGGEVTLSSSAMDPASTTLSLTTSWKRYSLAGVLPGRYRGNHIGIRIPGRAREKITVWADALQFEKGEDPTAFER